MTAHHDPALEPQWYFAYGANMNRSVLENRRNILPTASVPAFLDDHRLTFDEPGIPVVEPCFASIRFASGQQVHGVAHRLSGEDMARLNAFEGPGYDVVRVRVRCGDELVEAVTYQSRKRAPGRKPSCRYLALMIEGATQHQLPPAWIAYLRSVPCSHIPVLSRAMPAVLHGLESVIRSSARGTRAVQRLYGWLQTIHEARR